MPPRIPRLAVGLARNSPTSILPRSHQICPICSLAQASISSTRHRTSRLKRREPGIHVRKVSSQTKTTSGATDNTRASPGEARNELREALLDLQKHAGSFVSISRLQLALRGLEQPTGQETIRIAILALADGGASLRKAKELLRLIAADPLKSEEEWERLLIQNQKTDRPLLLKIGHEGSDEQGSRLVQQLNIASPMLNGHNLELLVLEMEPTPQMTNVPEVNFGDSVLVPTMEIPTSSSGRYTPVTTPVHRAIIVGNGIAGACTIMSLPVAVGDPDVASAAMDLEISNGENDPTLPFKIVDLPKGITALSLFRESLDNAVAYEEKWFASGIPQIAEWIKLDSAPLEGVTKEPLKRLIYSLIESAYAQLETERSKRLAALLSDKVSSSDLKDLKLALGGWAERAHTELRDDLDIAFEGRRWRKLGWWKLFWRVDDVSMIASDILSQRFLTNAEKEIIFLSGRINQSGIAESIPEGKPSGENWAYKPVPKDFSEKLGSEAPDTQLKNILELPEDTEATAIAQRPWPLQIPITRGYLSSETVPALQALSQKLVLQTLSTSFFSSAFGGLVYVSTLSAGLYEAGAVAALGIVWSLRRMQKKWETARSFWEGEVREEGRKAVRGVESEVGELLVPRDRPLEGAEDLEEAEKAIAKVETTLRSAK